MKRNFFVFIGILALSIGLLGEPTQKPAERSKTPFIHGEKLTFRLHYGFISGGYATFTLLNKKLDNKPVFHAKVFGTTSGLTRTLFPVDDTYESYFDPNTCLPYKAIRDISEGGYKYYNEVLFSPNDTSVISQKSGIHKVPIGTLDMVSSLYYLRNINIDTLKNGDVVNFITYFADEIFPFHLRYKGKETVKTEFGKIYCHRFDPVVEPGRIFKSEDDMSFWLTADENRIPVLIKFELIVGAVKCDLIEYQNVKKQIHWE